MIIYSDEGLSTFDFWGPAAKFVTYFSADELDCIEATLTDLYPDGIDATNLNDIFSYEIDMVASFVGFEDFEDLKKQHNESAV